MQVVFRVDASLQIGTGHVMRCLSLAEALVDEGAHVWFLSREHHGNLIGLVKSRGFTVHSLDAKVVPSHCCVSKGMLAYEEWLGCDWQIDAEQCRDVIANPVDWIIIDHYALDYRWESALRDKCRNIMCIDDLADRKHVCDVLLDQSLGRSKDDYHQYVSPGTRLLLGPQFALLRPQFLQYRNVSLARRENPKLSHVMVSLGGVDTGNATGRILNALKQSCPETLNQITVVLGPNAPWRGCINTLAIGMPVPTTVLSGVENMAELMTSCDLAIGAGGTTTWERCCLGVPTIQIELALNQKFICDQVSQAGASILCRLDALEFELHNALLSFSNPECLKRIALNAARMTDGKGVLKLLPILKNVGV